MRTAVGFAIGMTMCFGFLTRTPVLSLISAAGLLLALWIEFAGDED